MFFFAVTSSYPGSAKLVRLAGESREFWKWLQFCPVSCQLGHDRQVGFMINPPGVISGGILSKRQEENYYITAIFCLLLEGAG